MVAFKWKVANLVCFSFIVNYKKTVGITSHEDGDELTDDKLMLEIYLHIFPLFSLTSLGEIPCENYIVKIIRLFLLDRFHIFNPVNEEISYL